MGQFGMGQAVPREEDPRLLRGQGEFIADMARPNMAYATVLRSPHAHARIVSIDARAARRVPGPAMPYSRHISSLMRTGPPIA